MNIKSHAVALLGSVLLVVSCLHAPGQITIYDDGDATANPGDAGSWIDDNNWVSAPGVSPVVHESPATIGSTAQVEIGTVPSAASQGDIIVDTGDATTIASLAFNSSLTGSLTIESATNETLQINGAITNNSNYAQTLALATTFAGANATYAGGTGNGSLLIGNLDLNTFAIATTGTVTVSTNLYSTINSATSFGHIGAISATPDLVIQISTFPTRSYTGNVGDFFQIATGTFTGATASVSDAPLSTGLSWVTSLIQKGILFVEPTAGGTTINSGVILPIDKDSEFNVAGTGITFNGTTSAAELLTDNSETGTPTPFSTARAITINASSAAIIAAMNGTTATYTGVISDAGGTAGTLAIGDSTNHGTVVLAGPSTYAGGTTVATATKLEIGNTTGSATGTGAVNLSTGALLQGISATAAITGQVNLVGNNTVSTSTGTLTVGGLNVSGTGNTIGTGTINGLITQNAGSALTVSGAAGADNLATTATLTGSGTGSVGAVSLAGSNTLTGPLTTGLITVNGTSTSGSTILGTITGSASQSVGSALVVTGTLSGADNLVAGATTLSGTGTVGGVVTLNGGGNVISSTGTLNLTGGGITVNGMGNTIGTGTINGLISQASGSTLTVSGAAGADNLATTATLTGSGTGSVGALALAGGNTITGPLTTGLITVNGTTTSIIAGTVTSTSGASQIGGSALAVNGTLTGPDTLAAGATKLSGTGTVGGLVTLNGGGNVISSTGTLNLTGGGITVNGMGNTIGTGTITGLISQASGSTLTVSGAAGADNLLSTATLTGSGTGSVGAVSLAGGNTLTGPLTTGLITVNGTSASASTIVGTLTGSASQSAGSALVVTGTLSGADNLVAGATTLSGTGTVGGLVTLNGGGNAISSTGTLNLTGGGITVNGMGNTIGTGTITGLITQTSGSALTVSGAAGADNLATTATLTGSGTGSVGALALAGGNTITGPLTTGLITVNGTATSTIAGTVTSTSGASQIGGSALAVNGTLTGPDTLAAGTTKLSGTGTVGGLVTLNGGGNAISSTGTLNLTGGGIAVNGMSNTIGTGTITGLITQASGSALTVSGAAGADNLATTATLTGSGTGSVGALALAGGNTITGPLTTGLITVNGTTTSTIAGTVTSTSGASQTAGSALAVNGTLTGPDAVGTGATLSGTGTVGAVTLAGTDTLTSSSTLTTGGITLSGLGNQITSGIVTGNTTLNAGSAFTVNGTLNGSLGVGTATLSGTGTISGPTTVGTGKIDLTTNNAIGTLSVGGLSLTGSTLNFEIGGTTTQTDKIAAGTLSIGGGSTVINISNLGGTSQNLAVGDYTLLSYTNTTAPANLANLHLNTTTLDGDTLTLVTTSQGVVQVDVTSTSNTQTFTSTSPSTINIITGSTTTVTTSLNNTNPTGGATVAVNLSNNGGTGGAVTGLTSSSGATVAPNSSSTVTGTFTGGTVGTGETYSIKNTDPNATPTIITTGGTANVYNHAVGTLTVTSPTPVKAITGTSVTSTLTFKNSGANNDNLTIVNPGTGVTGLNGTFAANAQTTTVLGTTTAGAAGGTTSATYSTTYQEDQNVIGATPGNQTATAATVTITDYNHAVGVLNVTSPTLVKAISGTVVNSTLTFGNNGANNDNLTIVATSTGVTGLNNTTFVGNQQVTTAHGATTAGAAGSTTSATYSATYLEDQSVIGATAGNQTATAATVTITDYSHAVGVLAVTSPTTIRAIAGTTIDSTFTFTNSGATNDNLTAGTATGGLMAATGIFMANQSTPLNGSFVAGAVGTMATNTFTQNYQEDQTVLGATAGTQTATAGVTVTSLGHSAPSLSATADNFGFIHEGSTALPNATTTLSNGTGDLAGLQIVSLGGLTDSGTGLIAAGTGRSLSAGISTATAGAYNMVYTIQTEDDQTVVGATANANQTFTVSGNVYTGQGVWNAAGGGTWGTIAMPLPNWTALGGTPGLDANFTTTDSATFGNSIGANTAIVTLDGDNPSLKAITFDNTDGGNYTIATGSVMGSTLKLNAGTATAAVTDSSGNNTISANMALNSNTAVSVTSVADTLTLSGNISGAGTSALILGNGGAGTILLSGTNTFTGATMLTSGTTMLGSVNALTSSTSVTQTGGTLDIDGHAQTLQNFSSTGGTLTNSGGGAPTTITFDEGGDPVSNSDITGNVAINKTGPGLLALTGTDSYTGDTTITAGTLEAGSNTAFGMGNVINNGGTLGAYGAQHSINVAMNYTQAAGATLMINLNVDQPVSAANDVLNVAGTASLEGHLDIHFGFLPVKNDTFVVVTTGGGITALGPGFVTPTVLNQMGIDVTGDLTDANHDVTLSITSAQLSLTNALGSFYTPNRAAITTYLSSPSLATTDPILYSNLINLVTNSSAQSVPQLLANTADEFNPAKFGNFVQSTIVNNSVFSTQELDSYFEGGRSTKGDFLVGNGTIDSSGLSVVDPSVDPSLAQVSSRLLAWSPAAIGHGLLSDSGDPVLAGVDSKEMTPEPESLSGHDFSTFVVGSVILAQNFSQTDVAHSDTSTGGVQIGADYRITPHLRAGVMFGYSHTDGTLDTNNSTATIDSYAPGAYVTFADNGWYANAMGSYGFNSFTEDRHISLPGGSAVAHGAPSGDQINGDLDGGYDFHIHKLTFGPLAGVQYTHLNVDSYSEDGAEALGSDLAVGNQRADSLRSRVGGHVSYVFQTGKVLLTPHLDASWQHEFMDQADGITAGVTEGGPAPFRVTTQKPSRDSALLDAGLNAELNGQVSVFGDYLVQAGQSNYFGQSVQAGVKIGF
jgi:uncharacterized protein with beta-barrel porin domain